jgi:protein SCO1/2
MALNTRFCTGITFLAILTLAANVLAQRKEPAPAELEEVGITENLGGQLPLDLPFTESNGRELRLGDLLDGERPALLTLNYSSCPMLCSLQLNGLFDALGDMKWDLGENFVMLTASIDPTETPARAQLTKQNYLKDYGRPGVAGGWRCITGEEANIKALADAVGFHYTYVEDTGEYAHAAVTIVLTPDGRVSRYLYGVEYDPQTIRLSLVEAADGGIGSSMDQILLFCFHYDATKGRYGPAAQNVMRFGGFLTIVGVVGMIAVFWRRSSQRVGQPAEEEPQDEDTESVK